MGAGHKRYAHVTALRSDQVLPGLLGMDRIVSEDSLRRALSAMPEQAGLDWLQGHIDATVRPLLAERYIIDIDTTVKPLYGHQEGAVVSYNPKKPGHAESMRPARPSHVHHTYMLAGLRLVMGVETAAGVVAKRASGTTSTRAHIPHPDYGSSSTACRATAGRHCCAATAASPARA